METCMRRNKSREAFKILSQDLIDKVNLVQAGNNRAETENGLQNCQQKVIMKSELPSTGVGWGVSVTFFHDIKWQDKGQINCIFKNMPDQDIYELQFDGQVIQ